MAIVQRLAKKMSPEQEKGAFIPYGADASVSIHSMKSDEFETLLRMETDGLKRRMRSWYQAEQTMLEREAGLPRNRSRVECFELALPHYERCYRGIISHVHKNEHKGFDDIEQGIEMILRNGIDDLNLIKACHEPCLNLNDHCGPLLKVMHEGFQQVGRAFDIYQSIGLVTSVMMVGDSKESGDKMAVDIRKNVHGIASTQGGMVSLKQVLCEILKSCGRIGLLSNMMSVDDIV